mgnify:CR=1 FL=1
MLWTTKVLVFRFSSQLLMFVSMKSLTKSKGQTFEKPKSGISSLDLIQFFYNISPCNNAARK